MAVSANLFVTDSLVGSTLVKNTFANIVIGTRPLAFIGDQSFVIKLRRNSFDGDVIATTPQITIRDNAALVSFVANTSTVAEGDLVEFTLTTTGAANNAVLYYNTLNMTPNVDARDFLGANAGSFTIVDNVGKIVLRANTDGSLMNEAGETFKLQIRTGSITGNIVVVSDNVSILDTSNVASYFISHTSNVAIEGDAITFTIDTINLQDGTEVFYTTEGNILSSNFTTGNTGSRILVNSSNTITLTTTQIPVDEVRQFVLQLREGSTSGQVKATSQNIVVYDASFNNLVATGGSISDSGGFRTHTFTSSDTFNITKKPTVSPVNIQYLIVAGGGAGGISPPATGTPISGGGSGGGAGGVLVGNLEIISTVTTPAPAPYTVTVGGGGTAGPSSTSGSPSFLFDLTAVGGGGGLAASGSPGGSGAGAIRSNTSAGEGTPGQGNPGGGASGTQPQWKPGGGGGAGAAGTTAPDAPSWPAPGGVGVLVFGNWYGGGGGGGGTWSGAGGTGGGGSGTSRGVGNAGGVFTGGGGGGGGSTPSNPPFQEPGGNGGSGIVIVRYPYAT